MTRIPRAVAAGALGMFGLGALDAPATLPSPGPPLDVSAFRYTRTLAGGPPGPVAVPLDAAVLAHSAGRLRGDFADLRIVDAAGRQLPYLLDRRPEPLAIALPPATAGRAPAGRWPAGTTFYRVTLPHAGLPPARLVLRTMARVFEREVKVLDDSVPGGRPERARARVLASATWRHAEPDTAPSALTLSLPGLAGPEVLLAVFEGDNSPLPLAAPELLLPSWHVRFFRSGRGELRVVYGRAGLEPPRYDLALLAPAVLASPATEAALGPEQEATRSEPVILRPGAFWAIMIGAVSVLLILIARLVREAGPPSRE